jgi:hypothetical protein
MELQRPSGGGSAVKDPQEALGAARSRAAEARRRGDYPSSPEGEDLSPSTRITDVRLTEWAIIEPDHAEIYSTRRFGRPITAVKRLLIRFLRQYFDQVTAQQSRFNAQVAAHIMNLDERVHALEDAARAARDENRTR